MEQLLTEDDVVRLLGITKRSLRRLRTERRIGYIRAGRAIRFRQRDLDDYVEARLVEPV